MHLFTFTERCVVLQSELEMSQIDLRLAKETASLISEFTDCVNVWVIYCFINKKLILTSPSPMLEANTLLHKQYHARTQTDAN